MKNLLRSLLLLFLPLGMSAQLFQFYAESGMARYGYRSKEMPVFLASYNAYNSASGLTQPFNEKMPMPTGYFYQAGCALGGKVRAVMGMGGFHGTSKANEARFSDGSGRDLRMKFREFNFETGVRFTSKIGYLQLHGLLMLQRAYVYSAYIWPDGSPSYGWDHTLNGIYEDFGITGGGGASVGVHVYGPFYLVARADYVVGNTGSHPEYHQYEDLNYLKVDPATPDYLPRDMNTYVNDPFNGSGNSISNDFKGFRYSFSIQFISGDHDD